MRVYSLHGTDEQAYENTAASKFEVVKDLIADPNKMKQLEV